jgi:hypothetical protein
MVPCVHVSIVECVPVGLPWCPLHARVEDREEVMQDCVEGEVRLGSFLRSVSMRFHVTVKVLTSDWGRQAMVNERSGGGCGLGIHRPGLPEAGGLVAS